MIKALAEIEFRKAFEHLHKALQRRLVEAVQRLDQIALEPAVQKITR